MGDSRVRAVQRDPESLRQKETVTPVTQTLGALSLGPLVAVPGGQGMLSDAEVEERLVMRRGRRVCRKCDSVVLLDQVLEVEEVETEEATCAGWKGQDECDGGGRAKVAKVIIKCQCRDRMSFLKRRHESFIFNDTEIMAVYRDYHEKLTADPGQEDPEKENGFDKILGCMRANSISEDIADHHMRTVTIAITNPMHGPGMADSRVEIGLVVTTLRDEEGHLRHFVYSVRPDSPADNMELRDDDELLLLNDQLLVDTSPDKMEELFAAVEIDQEFSLLTRRVIEKSKVLGLFSRPGTDYEYWQIRATVTVDQFDDPILADKAHFTKAHLTNGDLLIMREAHVRPIYLSSEAGYLKASGSRVTLDPNIQRGESAFQFDLLTYSAKRLISSYLQDTSARMIRHTGSGTSFLYVNDAGNVKLKRAPSILHPEPTVEELNTDHCYGSFCIKNAMFLTHEATDAGEKYFLESYAKQKRFLKSNSSRLMLHRVNDVNYLPYMDNVTFEVISLD